MARVERPPRGDAMDSFLAKKALYRKPIAKDASSLFRVFSEAIFNVQIFHVDIKQRCISFLRDEANDCPSEFDCREDFDSHVVALEAEEIRPGLTEIQALCRIFDVSLSLFKDVNADPEIIYSSGRRRVMATCDPVNHYDLVFPIEYLGSVAFCQSVVYELLYRNVFGLGDEIEIGMRNLHTKTKRGCVCDRAGEPSGDFFPRRASVSSSGDQDVDIENPENDSFENSDSYPRCASSPASDASSPPPSSSSPAGPILSTSLSPPANVLCPRHSRERPLPPPMPFPFRVAKALDPEIYRNVEHDTWYEGKKQEEIDATCEMFVKPFMEGDRCLVTLENKRESSSFYHAHIQRMPSDAGPVRVFIEEFGEMRDLPLKNLRTLPTNQRSFTNRQFKHLKSLRFSPDLGSNAVPTLLDVTASMPPPSRLQAPMRGRFNEGRAASRGYGHFDRPVLNACGKPRRDKYGNPQFQNQHLQPRFVQPLRLNGFFQSGCILPGGLRGASGSVMEPALRAAAPPPLAPHNKIESLAPLPQDGARSGFFYSSDSFPHGKAFVVPPRFQEKRNEGKSNFCEDGVDAPRGRFRSRSDSICSSDVEVKIEIPQLAASATGAGRRFRVDSPPRNASKMTSTTIAAPIAVDEALTPQPMFPLQTPTPPVPVAVSPAPSFASEPRASSTPLFFPCAPMSPFDPPLSSSPGLCFSPQMLPAPSELLPAPQPHSAMPTMITSMDAAYSYSALGIPPQVLGCPSYPPPSLPPMHFFSPPPQPSPDMMGFVADNPFALQLAPFPPLGISPAAPQPLQLPLQLPFSPQPMQQHSQDAEMATTAPSIRIGDACEDASEEDKASAGNKVSTDVAEATDAADDEKGSIESASGSVQSASCGTPGEALSSSGAAKISGGEATSDPRATSVAFEQNASDDVKLSLVAAIDPQIPSVGAIDPRSTRSDPDPIEADAAIIVAGKPETIIASSALPPAAPPIPPLALPHFSSPFPMYSVFPFLPDSAHPPPIMHPFPTNVFEDPQRGPARSLLSDSGNGGGSAMETMQPWPPHPSMASPSSGIPLVTPPPSPALPLISCGSFEMVPIPFGDVVPPGNFVPLFYPSPAPSPALLSSISLDYWAFSH